MLDTHEKVKNALSNGAMETLADQEVEVVGAAPTPYVPLIGDDNNVRFGPVPPPNPQPRNYIHAHFRQEATPRRVFFRRGFTFKETRPFEETTQVCAVLPPSLCTYTNTCHCAGL
jgi:hypothetical protein